VSNQIHGAFTILVNHWLICTQISKDGPFSAAYPVEAATLGSWNGKKPQPEVYKILRDAVLQKHPGRAGLGLQGRKGPRLLRYRVEVGASLPQLVPPRAGSGAERSVPTTARAPQSRSEASPLPPLKRSPRASKSKKPSSRKKKK